MLRPNFVEANMGELRINLGKRVQAMRGARRWTQEELGRKAGLGPKYIGVIERGEKASFEAVEKLAKAFDIECYELFVPVTRRTESMEKELNALLDDESRINPAQIQDFLRGLRALLRKLDRKPTA